MSDRLRRRKSPPRGRSKSRAKSRGRSPSPPLKYTETTTRTVHRYATQTQSYQDYYSGQASGGTKSDASQYHGESDSEDSEDDITYDEWRNKIGRHNVMENIESLA